MEITVLGEILKTIFNSCSKSSLQFRTSRSFELTGGEGMSGGGTIQGVCIEDLRNGETQWFNFVGAGMGLGGGLPVNWSFSTQEFDSYGSRILEHPFAWNLNFDDLVGAGHIFTVSAIAGVGAGVSILCFGEPLGEPTFAQGYMVMEGAIMGGAASAGAMAYKGVWVKGDS